MHRDDDTIFDEDALWTELERPDDERRRASLRALDALGGDLATLRTRADGVGYVAARHAIFRRSRLRVDLERGDAEIQQAAVRVRDAITRLIELREQFEIRDNDRREVRNDIIPQVGVITSLPGRG